MKFKRLILGLIFILLLLVLCYNYSIEGYYQDISVVDLLNGNSGNQVIIYGPVTQIYIDGFEVYSIRNKNAYHIKTNLKLNLGADAYILGTLNSNNELIIIKMMIITRTGVMDVFLRSLLGLIIFLVVFLKYWKFSTDKILFIRRK